MKLLHRRLTIALAVTALASGTASAGEADPAVTAQPPSAPASHGGFSASGDLVVRGNPGGAILFLGLAYRRPYRFDAVRQTDAAAITIGLGGAGSGAFVQGGPFVEWMPVLPLQLRAQYDVYGFFGTNGSLLSFPSASSSFGGDAIDARAGTEERATAHRLLLRPTLRMKLGRVVLRHQTDVALYEINGSGPFFLEREHDTLLEATDALVSSRTGLLFVLVPGRAAPGLVLGPAYEITYAFGAELARQRVGVQGSWVPDTKAGGMLAGLRVYGMAGVNLQDRNRTHEPFVMLGVGTDVNL